MFLDVGIKESTLARLLVLFLFFLFAKILVWPQTARFGTQMTRGYESIRKHSAHSDNAAVLSVTQS